MTEDNHIEESKNHRSGLKKFRNVGPGIVAGSSGNDAGGITTNTIVGSKLGYRLLWLMLITIPMLIVVHDMCARTSTVAKRGIGSIIRKKYGARIALALTTALFIANIAVVAANLAGMSVALELVTGINFKWFIIPLAFLVWLIVTRGSYAKVEKILLIMSLGLLSYMITAFIARPDWGSVLLGTFIPSIEFNISSIILAVGLLGATVSPYIYYYYASAELEKKRENIADARFDARMGATWVGIVGYFIILTAAAVLFTAGINNINTAKDAAMALRPLAGEFTFILFALGLFAASMIASAVLPISTSYAVCETFGLESGVDHKPQDAPVFYFVFSISLAMGVAIMLMGFDPIQMMFLSMVMSGVLTPVLVAILLKICNDKDIMENYTNNWIINIIGYAIVAITAGFVILMFGGLVLGL